jgi:hypothetical protein
VYLEDILPGINYNPPAVRGGEKVTAEQSQSFRDYFEKSGVRSDTIRSLEAIRRADRIDYQVRMTAHYCLTNADRPLSSL